MNNAETLLTLSKHPNDICGRIALRRNNADLLMRIIKEWFGQSPLVYETLLTRCAESARHFVPWRDDPDEFIVDCLQRECRILYARSKMGSHPASNQPGLRLELRLSQEQETPEISEKEDDMELNIQSIRETVCQDMGHLFRRTDFVYARDEKGTAFQGEPVHTSAKFTKLFCARCMALVEVEICPPLEVRFEKEPKDMRAAA